MVQFIKSNSSWGWGWASDNKVKYDAWDPTWGYLWAKTVAGTGITLAEWTGGDENKLKITNSAPDQTIANTSDWTSHTVTLSASWGSVKLIEWTWITLTTWWSSSAGEVTIASTATGGWGSFLDSQIFF